MKLHIIRKEASRSEMDEMLEAHGDFVKLAVDVGREILAGGGDYHADCEEALLLDGSSQADVWGADWLPTEKAVEFGALINVRPAQGNRSIEIQSAELRTRVERIVRAILGGLEP
jgi:hypothetical protein